MCLMMGSSFQTSTRSYIIYISYTLFHHFLNVQWATDTCVLSLNKEITISLHLISVPSNLISYILCFSFSEFFPITSWILNTFIFSFAALWPGLEEAGKGRTWKGCGIAQGADSSGEAGAAGSALWPQNQYETSLAQWKPETCITGTEVWKELLVYCFVNQWTMCCLLFLPYVYFPLSAHRIILVTTYQQLRQQWRNMKPLRQI